MMIVYLTQKYWEPLIYEEGGGGEGISKQVIKYIDKEVHTFLSMPLSTMNVSPRVSMVSSDRERLPLLTDIDALL